MIKCGDTIIEPTIFPDGTSQVWMDRINLDDPDVWWWFESEAELIHLAQFAFLRADVGNPIERLLVPFFPYARQHKNTEGSFALWPFLRLLNQLDIPTITTLDLHDDQIVFGGWGIESVWSDPFIKQAIAESKADLLLYPDLGAADRYGDYEGLPTIVCEKHREPRTGAIKGLSTGLESAGRFKDARVLIVDDICDGGATFVRAAELANAYGAREVFLYVTHGIFSKGIKPLLDAGIDHIYTTDSFPRGQHYLRGVTVFDCKPILEGALS